MTNFKDDNLNPLVRAIKDCRTALIIVFMFAFACNLLSLITSVYALQVLDRVLGSGSLATLGMLTLIMALIYLALHMIQVARSFTLIKIGEWLDNRISPKLFSHAIEASSIKQSMGASQSMREFNNIRSFLTSVGINSLFDAPWSIVYIAVSFCIHPYMGWLVVGGAAFMLVMGFLNSYAIDSNLAKSNEYSIKSMYLADIANRNAETVQAMGMIQAVEERWAEVNDQSLQMQSVASYRNGVISNITRFIRQILQMSVTAVGAYLTIFSKNAEMTPGYMIASSIIIGKALAPFDSAIEVWKQVTSAKKSYDKIKASFDKDALKREGMSIPNPEGRLIAENVFFAPPSANPGEVQKYTLRAVNFTLEPGKSLAIIGPSAAGKSTLVRVLAGIWKPMSGAVRLDGADVFAWNREDFGKHVGYLSQNVELFTGTVKENIARLSKDIDPAKVLAAAKISGAHDMISKLPQGYETDIGLAGSLLSGGQRQRVGLARAFYGDPKLIILDEPNSNLDEKGEQALVQAITEATKRHATVIIVSHRPSILAFVDMIMVVQEGMIAAYGPKEEVMSKLSKAAQQHQQ